MAYPDFEKRSILGPLPGNLVCLHAGGLTSTMSRYEEIAAEIEDGDPEAAAEILSASAALGVGYVDHLASPTKGCHSLNDARDQANSAKDKFAKSGDKVGLADAVILLETANCLIDMRDQPDKASALDSAKKFETQFASKGDKRGVACMKLVAAELKAVLGQDLQGALTQAEEACGVFSQEGDKAMEACAQLVLAVIFYKKQRASEVAGAARAALALFTAVEDRVGQAKALHAKALGFSAAKDFPSAVKSAQKAAALYSELGNVCGQKFEFGAIAQLQLLQGRPNSAMEAAKKAYSIDYDAPAMMLMCQAAVAAGKPKQAVSWAEKYMAFQGEGKHSYPILVYSQFYSEDPTKALDWEFPTRGGTVNDALKLVQGERFEMNMRYLIADYHMKEGRYEEASQSMKLAAAIASRLKDTAEEGHALRMASHALGSMPTIGEDESTLDDAIELAENARAQYKKAGLSSEEVSVVLMMASLKAKKPDADSQELATLAEEAQELANGAGDISGEVTASNALADLYGAQDRHTLALSSANKAVELCKQEGNKKGQAEAMYAVANLQMMMKSAENAVVTISDALTLCNEVGANNLSVMLAILLVQAKLQESDVVGDAEAQASMLEASEAAVLAAKKAGDKKYYGVTLGWRAQILAQAGRGQEALEAAIESSEAFEGLDDPKNKARSMVSVAELLKGLGQKAAAKEKATEAIAVTSGDPECAEIEADATALIASLQQRAARRGGGGGKRMVRKLVKKWRKKGGGGGGGSALSLDVIKPKILELVKSVIADDDEGVVNDVPFMEAGIDSLGSVQLLTDVSKEFAIQLAPSAVFDYPSVTELAKFLVAEGVGGGGGGGGPDEWEEYEDWEEVEEDVEGGGDDDYVALPTAAAAPAAAAGASVAEAAPAKKGLDIVAVRKQVTELVKSVLTDDDEEIHNDTAFMEAGIDSLGSVQLITDVSKAFSMQLAPSAVFDYPSVGSLSDHLVQEAQG